MSIGTTIKKLRREKDLTQEQLAEYLGITPKAISQWECDRTSPDISQLPMLAYILNTTTDALLGVDIKKAEEEIDAIIESMWEPYEAGENKKCEALLREGLKRYPRSYRLMVRLANVIPDDGEIVSLCEKVIEECTDNDTRNAAFQELIYQHNNMGRKEEAIRLARQMSDVGTSKEEFLATLLTGEEGIKERIEYLKFCSGRVMMLLNDLAKEETISVDDRIALTKQAAAVIDILYPDGDYHYYACIAMNTYGIMADLYASQGMAEETLSALEQQCAMTVHFATYAKDAVNTSPAFRGQCDGGWVHNPEKSLCEQTLEEISAARQYDFVRDNPRYKAVEAKLRKNT